MWPTCRRVGSGKTGRAPALSSSALLTLFPRYALKLRNPSGLAAHFFYFCEGGGGGHAFLFIIFLCTKVSPFCKYCVTLSVKHFKR